ncbi:MAG TPA: glycosyltransferase [Vicinamibacterales bacterium]|nr:glycosyltransferase [Vicinamibacterales bacterium]
MKILHVTPHLPPDQAANALLPWLLGQWSGESGDDVEYLAHPPRAAGGASLPGPVTWIPRRHGRSPAARWLRLDALPTAWHLHRSLAAALERCDLVHAHSNGLLPELAVLLARRAGKPVVLTLYGTEIWHYGPKRIGPDLFTRAYHAASAVTFYSERLLARARELGLNRRGLHTIYPPVGPAFVWHDASAQAEARRALGIGNRQLLLNVKRLHPLAGQRHLIEAMSEVIRTHPDTRLVICGTGALLEDLQSAARSAGVERHVTFTGLLDNTTVARYCGAADLFVLPSLLEALPTVALEALACGTPVLSTDNPGGLELYELFGRDVAIVPREQPLRLARAIVEFFHHKRRAADVTAATIEREFRPHATVAAYRAVYVEAQREARS